MFTSRTPFISSAIIATLALSSSATAQSRMLDSSRLCARDLMNIAVSEAFTRNLALQQTAFAEERAGFAVREANGRLLPSAGLNARYTESSGTVNIGDFINPAYSALNQIIGQSRFPTNINATLPERQETKFAISQPVYNDALFGARDYARSLKNARGAERQLAMRQLAADVQLAWLGYASATRVKETLDNTRPVLKENLRVSERLVANGQATVDATYRARAELSELDQQIAEAEQRQRAARRQFNLLLDKDADASIALADDSSLLEADTLALIDAVMHATREREELDVADFGIEGARAQRRIANSAWRPAVAVAADYGVRGDRYRFDSKHDVATASLVLTWNVFNGGQDQARKEQAMVALDAATLKHREIENAVRIQVTTSRDALLAARTSLVSADDRLEAAHRSFTLVERRYAEGLASPVEFLVARSSFTNAAVNQVLTRYSYAARVVDFERVAALRKIQ